MAAIPVPGGVVFICNWCAVPYTNGSVGKQADVERILSFILQHQMPPLCWECMHARNSRRN